MVDEIDKRKFTNTKFNLVRFNPDIKSNYKEPPIDKLEELFKIINKSMTNNQKSHTSRIITRVGKDVYASCGMFINDEYL